MTRRLAFLDTETTGLDRVRHQVWEVAYAIDDGPIVTLQLPHDLDHADPAALEINGYADRVGTVTLGWRQQLLADLDDVILVGSNPGFDQAMLSKALDAEPWHYRCIDAPAGVMWLLDWDEPRGLLSAAREMRGRGHTIPMPDHTAAGDVATTRAVYRAVRGEHR
ncbi:hypothetical protein GCM10009795_040110 [Nocardioides hankookensis]|uniref:Exonuclease domain-containing protein n=1 Tax=Nocardioides hankookensis TaxID=443157 RepID=A0ABW1LQF6_9ACTN